MRLQVTIEERVQDMTEKEQQALDKKIEALEKKVSKVHVEYEPELP